MTHPRLNTAAAGDRCHTESSAAEDASAPRDGAWLPIRQESAVHRDPRQGGRATSSWPTCTQQEREALAASYGLGAVPEWRIEDFKARCHLVLPGR